MTIQQGMIQEITNLYVKINDVRIRYTYLDGVDMVKVGDIVEYETEESVSKTDPEIKSVFLKPKSLHRADTPKASEAFTTADKIIRTEDKAQGVVVAETVKKPALTNKEAEVFVVTPEQWKAMNPDAYKPEQTPKQTVTNFPREWILPPKDVLIVRQTCLERAVEVMRDRQIVESGKSRPLEARDIVLVAEAFEQWVLRK